MALNQDVLKKNHEAEQSKMIVGLRDENKILKTKINMVIEKDEEIYRLQCENTLLQKDNAEIKASTITDYTLKRDNDQLVIDNADLATEAQGLRDQQEASGLEINQLKQTIVALAKARSQAPQTPQTPQAPQTPQTPQTPQAGLVLVNVQNLKSSVALRKQYSCESKIDELLHKHRIADNQYVTKKAFSQLVQEALL